MSSAFRWVWSIRSDSHCSAAISTVGLYDFPLVASSSACCRASRIGSSGYVPSVVTVCLPPSLRRNCQVRVNPPSPARIRMYRPLPSATRRSVLPALGFRLRRRVSFSAIVFLDCTAWVTLWVTLRVGCGRTAVHISGRMTQQLLASIHSRGRPRTTLLFPAEMRQNPHIPRAMTVVTRFAPSPTGYLHIGGARTALFNWLFARHHGGKYLLRIEEPGRARSTSPAIDAILDGLSWLGLPWDGEVTYQFARAARHAEVAHEMLAMGKAYHCYASPKELEEMRNEQRRAGVPMRYDGRWRDRDPKDAPAGVSPVVRLKAPQSGQTVIQDAVQGEVKVENAVLDDMILLRADGTPTYMLAVVVDDQDMGVTHVIRGDDHLNNAFRQLL